MNFVVVIQCFVIVHFCVTWFKSLYYIFTLNVIIKKRVSLDVGMVVDDSFFTFMLTS